MAKYQQLGEQIIQAIEQGRIKPGTKMPSILKFKDQHQVSKTTALNCYHWLEEQGWLQARPQSGFFAAQPWQDLPTPEFPQFEAKATEVKTDKFKAPFDLAKRDSPFYASQLAPELTPVDQLNRCYRRANSGPTNPLNLYPGLQGDEGLIAALSRHISEHYFPVQENLVITNGCIDGVHTAIEVTTKPGDTVAITSPCFNGLLQVLKGSSRKVMEIPSLNNQLDLAQLTDQVKEGNVQACLLSSNHINPQGTSLPVEQKQKLAQMAKHYKVPIIEDDVFLEMSFHHHPLPIKHFDDQGWVLWCSSVSKTLSPAFRIGWCEPGRFFQTYLERRQVQVYGVAQPMQNMLREFIREGHYLKHLKKLRLTLAQQVKAYSQLLRAQLPASARVSQAEGGFVVWVQLPGLNCRKLFDLASAEGIYFRPGHEFSSRKLYRDCFRINAGWPLEQRKQELLRLCQLAKDAVQKT